MQLIHIAITTSVFVIYFSLIPNACAKKKLVNANEFISNEIASIGKKLECSLKTRTKTTVRRLWYRNKVSDDTHICLLKYLESNINDNVVWCMLGSTYSEKKAENEANFCFQLSSKLVKDDLLAIDQWHFLGPFIIGKSEFDGDPLMVYGGIQNVSRYRFDSNLPKYLSELSPNGEISWSVLPSSKQGDYVQVRPRVDWNDLVSSLGSMAITEWQGWLVGEFVTTQMEQTLSVQCFGVAKCLINSVIVAGDFYSRKDFWTNVKLTRGVHQVFVPLRAKVAANFKFSIAKRSGFQVLTPSFLPQIYDGYLPKETYLSIPICNQMSKKWLGLNRISVEDSSDSFTWKSSLYNKEYRIAPGQIMPVIIKVSSDESEQGERFSSSCKDIELEIKIKTTEGTSQLDVTLQCRKLGSSFLFTFIDHDGSVQHAAAVEPLGSCPDNVCPVVLTLHGTTVPPQNQADSYKKMVKGEFEFGVENMWLLAPTRHGAHNWEGPGALTAMAAVQALNTMVQSSSWFKLKTDPSKILFAGHSMGGHGALHLASHFPDRAIGLMSLAGWIKKEDYGDSNLFFRHDIATSHADPATKSVMESSVTENDADRHVLNLKGIPVLLRIGAQDKTVHPYFLRRMFRLMKEAKIDVHYSELPKMDHWWWDTKTTNDGGCMNDVEIRNFISSVHSSLTLKDQLHCSKDKAEKCERQSESRYSEVQQKRDSVTLVTFNPAFGETRKGIRVLQQILPLQKSMIEIGNEEGTLELFTKNIQCLELTDKVPDAAVLWSNPVENSLSLKIDGTKLIITLKGFPLIFCRQQSKWEQVSSLPELSRNPNNYGPARRVAEREFIIVVGTQGNLSVSAQILSHATYIANQFMLTSDTLAPIFEDTEIQNNMNAVDNKNLIIIGNEEENKLTNKFLSDLKDIKIEGTHISLSESCRYESTDIGILTLAPHGTNGLALLLMGRSLTGLADVVNLATPTIPPMARSPFSNLLPDYVITGPQTKLKGPGGFECIGFWDNSWRYKVASSSCVC